VGIVKAVNVGTAAGVPGHATRATWTPGKVAEVLGVSPVTLRSWSARYGIGPSIHGNGKHRRYSDLDVRRLQHMQRLIGDGMRAREAAATAFPGVDDAPTALSVSESVRQLGAADGELRFATIAAVLEDTLTVLGPVGAWAEVVAPVLRSLGGRKERGRPCFESEWALVNEVSTALQRYSARYEPMPPARPVLLACCPAERHSLPMEFLRAALLESGIPAVHLGQMVPVETAVGMAVKLEAGAVVLWSVSASTADELLAHRIQRRGIRVCAAGPGWEPPAGHGLPRVNDMAAALEFCSACLRV
jgi:hypothetical protein